MPVDRLVEFVLDKARPGWRERQARRKSLWHLPITIVMFALLGGLWFVLFRAMWQVHLVFHPDHAGHLQEFWSKGIRLQPFVASALLARPLFLPALGMSSILTNLIFWLIAPARRAFEREALGNPADQEELYPEMKFRGANRDLLKVTVRFLLPIGIGMSLVGAWLLIDLR